MLGYYDNKLCISARELIEEGFMTKAAYEKNVTRRKIKVMKRGGGAKGSCALVAIDSLPSACREQVEEKFGCDEARITAWVMSNYELDQAAVAFFMDWAASHKSDHATAELAHKYAVNASVLNTCIRLYERGKEREKLLGDRYDWSKMAKVIETLREQLGHDLPASTLRFRRKVNDYKKFGYECLITGKFGNQNKRKVTYKDERLVLSLKVLPNQPYGSDVHDMYIQFVCGELEAWDLETGELFNPDDFTDKNGEPKELSESTIRNILNKPSNRLLVEHALRGYSTFMHEQMPHMHRHGGEWSLSQITMDDVDLPRRMKGNEYVHAYYAYDVVSQCRIGLAYGHDKDDALVVECFRDMFRLIARHGWGIPAGIEVEQHLMSKYKGGFLKAGEVFKFVHFCAPQNSQEKYAEPLNGAFKTTIAHKNHEGVGRWYNKGARRVDQKKISDSGNHTWEDKKYYTFEELVADDRRDCDEWNHSLHPNQKRYPGMTRWDVLCRTQNPNLRPWDKAVLYRYIGEHTETTIRQNAYLTVNYEQYRLSSPEVIGRLAARNYKVDAYWLADADGKVDEVYIYQGGRLVDTCKRVVRYNEATAEQTEADKAAYTEQAKYVAKFDKMMKDGKIRRVGILDKGTAKAAAGIEAEALEIQPHAGEDDYSAYMDVTQYEGEAVAKI